MSGSIGLNKEELHEVTGYRIVSKQIQALRAMEIPFRMRLNGTPFVARSDIENPKPTVSIAPKAVVKPVR